MKKFILILLLFAFGFSFCEAQDTLVYLNGDRVVVKVIHVGRTQVLYSIPPKERQWGVKSKDLSIIKYADGKSYSYVKVRKRQDSMHIAVNPDCRLININAGIGASIITYAAGGNALFGGNINLLSETPAYNFTIDYNLINYFTLGLGYSYQSFTDNPNSDDYFSNDYADWEIERITRMTFSLRCAYSVLLKGGSNFYCGVRLGESFWTDQIIFFTSYVPPSGYSGYPELRTMTPTAQRLCFQLFSGFRFFPIYCLGFHAEIGIGTPYLVEGGITFRFKTRKEEAK